MTVTNTDRSDREVTVSWIGRVLGGSDGKVSTNLASLVLEGATTEEINRGL